MLLKARKESGCPLGARVLAEATEWFISLEETKHAAHHHTASQNARFVDWVMTSPAHLQAFLEISNVYYTLSDLGCRFLTESDEPAAMPNALGEMPSNVIRLKCPKGYRRQSHTNLLRLLKRTHHGTSMRKTTNRSLSRYRTRLSVIVAGITAAVASAACAWLFGPSFIAPQSSTAYYSTQVGERSFLPFEDGATVYLNTASVVVLQSTPKLRSVRLASGEALFIVSSPAKPFRVSTGDLEIDSLDTQFDVRLDAKQTLVSVLDGQVHLSCRCSDGEIVLAGGQQLQLSHENGQTQARRRTLSLRERNNLVAWRDGHLDFDGQTLAEAAREFNRYNRQQLVVDPELANLKIGGSFLANDVASFIAAVQKTFGVHAQFAKTAPPDPDIVLLSRKAP